MRGTAAITSRASGGSGTACACRFFVRLPGMRPQAPSALISARVMARPSSRRDPVSSSNWPSPRTARRPRRTLARTSGSRPPTAPARASRRRRAPHAERRVGRDLAVLDQPAEELRERPRHLAAARVAQALVAAPDAGHAVTARLVDRPVDQVAVDRVHRLVGPALGQPVLGLDRLAAVQRIAQAQDARDLAPAADLRLRVLLDELAHQDAEGGGVGLLARHAAAAVGGACSPTTSRPSLRWRWTSAASRRAACRVSGWPITGLAVSSRPEKSSGPSVSFALRPSGRRKRSAQLLVPLGWITRCEPGRAGVGDLAALAGWA